jgi:hypothetical protein
MLAVPVAPVVEGRDPHIDQGFRSGEPAVILRPLPSALTPDIGELVLLHSSPLHLLS